MEFRDFSLAGDRGIEGFCWLKNLHLGEEDHMDILEITRV